MYFRVSVMIRHECSIAKEMRYMKESYIASKNLLFQCCRDKAVCIYYAPTYMFLYERAYPIPWLKGKLSEDLLPTAP